MPIEAKNRILIELILLVIWDRYEPGYCLKIMMEIRTREGRLLLPRYPQKKLEYLPCFFLAPDGGKHPFDGRNIPSELCDYNYNLPTIYYFSCE
ncbi:MAG: hypothetical protein SCH70_02145 [Candidatus Methanoperedens sp.]|nr:hypothetical protein [Candidatus Methanoperedens sp.]